MELVERESTEGQGAVTRASTWRRRKGTWSTTMGPKAGQDCQLSNDLKLLGQRTRLGNGRVGETGSGWLGSVRSQSGDLGL